MNLLRRLLTGQQPLDDAAATANITASKHGDNDSSTSVSAAESSLSTSSSAAATADVKVTKATNNSSNTTVVDDAVTPTNYDVHHRRIGRELLSDKDDDDTPTAAPAAAAAAPRISAPSGSRTQLYAITANLLMNAGKAEELRGTLRQLSCAIDEGAAVDLARNGVVPLLSELALRWQHVPQAGGTYSYTLKQLLRVLQVAPTLSVAMVGPLQNMVCETIVDHSNLVARRNAAALLTQLVQSQQWNARSTTFDRDAVQQALMSMCNEPDLYTRNDAAAALGVLSTMVTNNK